MSELNSTDTNKTVGYIEQPINRIHHFYVSGELQSAENYTEWFQIIRSASSMDVIYIHINSEGGDAFTMIQLMRVLSESEAKVITSAEGFCASAATMLFLCGDQCEVSDHSVFMFHTFSSFSYGKGSEMFAQVSLERSWGEKLVKQVYKDFFTDKEIDALLDGKDYWMEADEVVKRLHTKRSAENSDSQGVKKRQSRKNSA